MKRFLWGNLFVAVILCLGCLSLPAMAEAKANPLSYRTLHIEETEDTLIVDTAITNTDLDYVFFLRTVKLWVKATLPSGKRRQELQAFPMNEARLEPGETIYHRFLVDRNKFYGPHKRTGWEIGYTSFFTKTGVR